MISIDVLEYVMLRRYGKKDVKRDGNCEYDAKIDTENYLLEFGLI